ncbi:MAG: beta-CASP ribonuclease aCPSF1 [Candidatus Aenigmarchaeota archaeon]|nr:beta-CASP ribonuclease aCPSF1 [Candidatus Aenigmarchaeota archaeon]
MNILDELKNNLPANAKISEVMFEASEIVLYTKNKSFFIDNEEYIRKIVSNLKKRVEVRPDISITGDISKVEKIIKEIVPEEAGIKAIYFEPEMGKVVIESQKPGLVIGKGGETYKKLKERTLWLPKIERAPAIDSKVVRAVRNLYHTEIDYRKKFLNSLGQKINTEPDKKVDERDRWVRMAVLGAGRQVGRSSILVETNYSNILLDCGVDVSLDRYPYLEVPEFNISKLDAVVLSHAHVDHCGYIPWLYENGYNGPLYCTAPTRDLMVLLCLDYIDVCQKDGRSAPYMKKAVETAVKHTIAIDYGEVCDITNDTRLTLQPSSHLLGSSLVHLHIGDGLHNILYTGDLKYGPTKLFDPAYTNFSRVETIVTESTYGGPNDMMQQMKESHERLLDLVNKTMKRGGKVLIPSFAVGRGQEIMSILAQSNFEYPIYMEGMLFDATAIHTAYPEYLSRGLQKEIFHKGNNPFVYEKLKHIVHRERDDVIDSTESCVVIATSGMLVGGPAIEYLKAFASDKRNMLLFVGYQAEGTLGRRIQKGHKEIPISARNGRNMSLPIELEVETISGLSGHSDRRQLMNFIYKLSKGTKLERVVTVHGDNYTCVEFARDVHRSLKVETITPKNMEVMRLR